MSGAVRGFLTAALVALAGQAGAEVRYISDELRVPLRAGPSGEHRILHWGLPSGMTLEVLSEDEAAGVHRSAHRDRHDGLVAAPISGERTRRRGAA